MNKVIGGVEYRDNQRAGGVYHEIVYGAKVV